MCIVNHFNSYERINLIQSSRSKLQLSDFSFAFCQISLQIVSYMVTYSWQSFCRCESSTARLAGLGPWQLLGSYWFKWPPRIYFYQKGVSPKRAMSLKTGLCWITFTRGKVIRFQRHFTIPDRVGASFLWRQGAPNRIPSLFDWRNLAPWPSAVFGLLHGPCILVVLQPVKYAWTMNHELIHLVERM